MIDATMTDRLRELVFKGVGQNGVYAVLDGAMVEGLPARLDASGCEHACLFSGELDPMLEAAAPHLVQLRKDVPFSDAVLQLGWNDHWGIILHAGNDLDFYGVRQHLRRHLRVQDAAGNPMFFRFYDPRVFRVVIPSLASRSRREFFGAIRRFLIESEQADALLCFETTTGKVRERGTQLTRTTAERTQVLREKLPERRVAHQTAPAPAGEHTEGSPVEGRDERDLRAAS